MGRHTSDDDRHGPAACYCVPLCLHRESGAERRVGVCGHKKTKKTKKKTTMPRHINTQHMHTYLGVVVAAADRIQDVWLSPIRQHRLPVRVACSWRVRVCGAERTTHTHIDSLSPSLCISMNTYNSPTHPPHPPPTYTCAHHRMFDALQNLHQRPIRPSAPPAILSILPPRISSTILPARASIAVLRSLDLKFNAGGARRSADGRSAATTHRGRPGLRARMGS